MKALVTTGIVLLMIPMLISTAWSQSGKCGLRGDYFYGTSFEKKILTRVDPQLNFQWDSRHLPASGLSFNYFSVRWSGQLYAPDAGLYYFSAQADDGLRLWIDGSKIREIQQRQVAGMLYSERHRTGVYLQSKQWYSIQVEHVNGWGNSLIQLYWELPSDTYSALGLEGTFRKIIPARYLSPITKSARTAHSKALETSSLTDKYSSRSVPTSLGERPKNRVRPTADQLIQTPDFRVGPLTQLSPFLVERGKATVLQSVQFAQSSYELLAESYPALNQLAQVLQRDSTLRIEIRGHTDNIGDSKQNLTLSEYRARQVAVYLIRKKIDERRVLISGYGDQRPIADNRSETERIKNRRVEIVIH